ncbi:hypothetical protein ANOM_005386 [Aspergillus nomiae NRRL 13137]|uniref:Uncharacterized protein n=1 Tax=Aspergillus nomiae NRRL (strain ATCC 15546 / NRRL 13137 / CBS 260.88 / M93) TaxID=1509407 RepID=A0A0L1J273_ASPN3|nr:uncharacterized protein ANOM_005386 [Aspergillus nomiae NRRL 13137]KNG85775.1 hypothetical protein ANOM_005386 [Aspergillus nomiae NRRL 13137]
MRLSTIVFSVLSTISSYAQATTPDSSQRISTDIFYWPIISSEPSVFARISYDPNSLESNVISYSPPITAQTESSNLVRVGIYTSNGIDPKQWTGTLTSWSAIAGSDGQRPLLQLYLDSSNKVYCVALTLSLLESTIASNTTSPIMKLIPLEAGPRPHLNRPVVVTPDGTNPEDIAEKTFFQKYWWVFLIITFLAMSGSGEEK